MVEDKSKRLFAGRRGRSNIAVAQTMEAAVLEPRCARPKNEIHMARNVAILVIMAPAIVKYCVLPAQETAMAKRHAVAIDARGEGLSFRPGAIFERDVLGHEIVGVDPGGRRAKRADGPAVGAGEAGEQIETQNGRARVVAQQMKEAFLALDVDQFPIRSRFDMDDGGMGGAAERRVADGRLDAGELPAAIESDHELSFRPGPWHECGQQKSSELFRQHIF